MKKTSAQSSESRLQTNISNISNIRIITHTTDLPDSMDLASPYPYNFTYLINPGRQLCNQEEIFMIIYVHSAPGNFERRLLIRQTWGMTQTIGRMYNVTMRLIFPMGMSRDNSTQQSLLRENAIYGDIVQQDFLDHYRNITYKAVMTMQWMTAFCRQAKFVFKTDDDVVANIGAILKQLKALESSTSRTVWCYWMSHVKAARKAGSKWFVTKAEFEGDVYPRFCSGAAFIFTGDLVPSMYNISVQTKFFWVDDVFLTGQVMGQLNVSYPTVHHWFSIYGPNRTEYKLIETKNPAFVLHQASLDTWRKAWNTININQYKEFLSGLI